VEHGYIRKGVRLCITGSEVMNGFILDKNTQFFASELYALGFELKESRVLPDNEEQILRAWSELRETGDIIINSGGLGPTSDDLTVDLLCKWLNDTPAYDPYAEKRTRYFFEKRASRMDMQIQGSSHQISLETALRQARIPSTAKAIKNSVGLAPGIYFPEIPFIALPGFPDEIRGMWSEVLSLIKSLNVTRSATKIIPVWGVGESQLFSQLEKPTNFTLGVHALPWGCRLFLRAPSEDASVFEEFSASLEKNFPAQIMESPVANLVEFLTKNRLSISVAESCTGGLAAKQITDIPGVSAVFKGGVVTYANEAKSSLINVSQEVLLEHGAVSAQCARSMAEGVAHALDTDVAIAFTGIAGPTGGTPTKPVGTVYIGIYNRKRSETRTARFQFPLGRERFRNASVACGFLAAYQAIAMENQSYWPLKNFH